MKERVTVHRGSFSYFIKYHNVLEEYRDFGNLFLAGMPIECFSEPNIDLQRSASTEYLTDNNYLSPSIVLYKFNTRHLHMLKVIVR